MASMSDVADQPLDGFPARRSSAKRRLSYSSQTSAGLRISTSESGSISRAGTRSFSIRSHLGSDVDGMEIHSPTPKRHFLLQTESSDLLNSRPDTPFSAVSTSSHIDNLPATSRKSSRRRQNLSFSSLHDQESKYSKEGRPLLRMRVPSFTYVRDANEASLGRRWIKWMHRNRLDDHVLACVVVTTLLVKWCVGLGGYSGEKTPESSFGDFEAQRHWMEITQHLPFREWYTYDLKWWGLDYPPLTAYHSYICGVIGSVINPLWFQLETSRGIETAGVKVFMRATVLASDLLIYVPAVIFFARSWLRGRTLRTQNLALLLLMLQPSLILIDSGHFQFNSVMLGLAVLALAFFAQGRDELGAICFSASLSFKQMALYYAPAVGSYLLSKCVSLGISEGLQLFTKLGVVTMASFAIAFIPWLPPFAPLTGIFDPITRIFPFQRGLFEDKVANFWCATNIFVKWRVWLSPPVLIKISTAATALGFLPSVICLVYAGWRTMNSRRTSNTRSKVTLAEDEDASPLLPILPWAMLASSMSFFLFSFQVHEKTILLPLLPLNLLLMNARRQSFTYEWGVLVNNVAVFSMYPLLKRDGLSMAYVAMIILWNRVIGTNPFSTASHWPVRYISIVVYSAILLLHLGELVLTPPQHYPDVYPVLNVLLSTPIFMLTWLWSVKKSIEVTQGVLWITQKED